MRFFFSHAVCLVVQVFLDMKLYALELCFLEVFGDAQEYSVTFNRF
jgi:hypothetical protein